jgi:hypothetical protein
VVKKAPDHGSRIRIRNTGDLINFCVSKNSSIVALIRIALFRWRSELQKHSTAEHGLKILEMKTCSLCHKEIVARRLNEHVKQAVLGIRICIFLGLPDPDPLVRGADPDPALNSSLFS